MAAVVNGLLVLIVPVAFVAVAVLAPDVRFTNVPAPPQTSAFLTIFQAALVMVPLSAFAAWRTRVHATRWRAGHVQRWRGVVEAGACGFVLALAYLAPGIVTRPGDAPPYVIFYGGVAVVLGLIVGLFLRTAAILVLRAYKSAAA